MKLREAIKALLPPVVLSVYRALRGNLTSPPEWVFVPEGWNYSPVVKEGWSEKSVVKVQSSKWQKFVKSLEGNQPLGIAPEAKEVGNLDRTAHNIILTFGYVLARCSRQKQSMSVLDWGGGLGNYLKVAQALIPELHIQYFCKELPQICEEGRRLLPEATFFSNDDSCFARSYDLVLASSSIQYSEDWKSTCKALAGTSCDFLYITRVPIVFENKSFVVLQRPYKYGYQTEYLGWFLNREEFINHLLECNMVLLREFLISDNPEVAGAPEKGDCRGYLFQKK